MSIEAMKLALEALEIEDLACRYEKEPTPEHIAKSIIALRQAIEQAEKQEPRCAVIVEVFGKDWRLDYMSLPIGKHKLYTQNYVYTTPPAAQRQWVGLTDEEILSDDILRYYYGMNGGAGPVSQKGKKVVAAIEAKLKEKNT
jgi:hypothetical protein